jgi:hypothetical protein
LFWLGIATNVKRLCDGGFYTQRIFKTAIAKPVLPAGAVYLAGF